VAEEKRFWHVLVSPTKAKRNNGSKGAAVVDRDRQWIEQRVLDRRRRGEPIAIGGRTFEWSEIERLQITVSDEPSATIIERLKAEDASSPVAVVRSSSYQWRAAARATDITDDLIDGPPGTIAEVGPAPQRVSSKKVMVVHGREPKSRRAMFDFLRALGLQPLEWGKLIEGTGKASPYVGEILEKAFEQAAAVVVLFTPDDEACLREALRGAGDPEFERELTPQARPNVLFEAGMAFGIHPERTILVEACALRPFSDIYGRHVIRLDGTEAPLRDIAQRLKTAGCEIDDSGTDWAAPDRFLAPDADH
jgi:predicted nucleotide-binding protein